jgi:photosystem II stability/assembly factor-like uncharacterized protein
MSGQVSAIAVDWVNDQSGNTVYVGSSSGGLWKSTNGLSAVPRFELLSDQNRSLSVGSVALDMRTNPPSIYVGTGAPDNSSNVSSFTGIGILISRDGGRTWKQVDSADNGAHTFVGQGFSSILVDPVQPNILLAATGLGTDTNHPHSSIPQGDPAFDHVGIYRSMDLGETWTQVMATGNGGEDPLSPAGFFHIDLLYERVAGNYFAGISNQGLFVSMDRGGSWHKFSDLPGWGVGLPKNDMIQRVSLATRENVSNDGTRKVFVWALILTYPLVPNFQLFQSDDGGQSWTPQMLPSLTAKGGLMYVAAPPVSSFLLVAVDRLYRRLDFQNPASQWDDITHNLHGDQHAIAFASPNVPFIWYVGDDGGAWATTTAGDPITDESKAWTSLNLDLRTLEFYSAAPGSDEGGAYAGGMQDNGPSLTGTPDWSQLVFGDGAYVLADPRDPQAFFMSMIRGTFFYVRLSTPEIQKNFVDMTKLNPATDFLTPFEILPTDPRFFPDGTVVGFDRHRARILLVGATNPWLVGFDPDGEDGRNFGATQLSGEINQVINYVAPDPRDPTTAYLTAGSTLYRLSNINFAGGADAIGIGRPTHDPGLPNDLLGHLAFSRTGVLYVIKIGFVDGEKIFRSRDGGNTWTNISGNLPNTPLHWVALHPDDPNIVFVAGGTGVYVALDGGVEGEVWSQLGVGLPNVPVMQMQISRSRKMIAATFGRGVWSLDVSNLRGVTGDPVLIQSTWGNQGNFELLVPQGNVIRHYVRDNDAPALSWRFLREFGYFTPPTELGPVPEGVTFIQSNFMGDGVHGNFEAIVRVSVPLEPDRLDFWFFGSDSGSWHGPIPIVADGVPVNGATGDPVLIQSNWGNQGNFELLVPQGNVIRHYARANDEAGLPWHFLREFGYSDQGPSPQSVTFIQSNLKSDGTHGNFVAIVRVSPSNQSGPDTLDFWFFDSLRFEWIGPFPVVADGGPVTGVTGDPVLIQSTFGNQGNFELLVPQGEVVRHYFLESDDPRFVWHFLKEFGFPLPPTELGPTPRGVTFIQSNYKGDGVHGNFEAIVRVANPMTIEPDSLAFWFFDSSRLSWNGPFLPC